MTKEKPFKPPRKVGRDAITGRFVSLQTARAEPDTHTIETIRKCAEKA